MSKGISSCFNFAKALGLAASVAAALPALGGAATVTINVDTPTKLVNAFKTADANPGNYYIVVVKRITNTDGSIKRYLMGETMMLTKGSVQLKGGSSTSKPADYLLDGQNARGLIVVQPATVDDYPSLELKGITLQNGKVGSMTHGGGIAQFGGAVYLTDSRVIKCSSLQSGGGLFNANGYLYLQRTLLDGNFNGQITSTAIPQTCEGGGMCISGSGYVEMYNSTFKNNEACRGGAITFFGTGGSYIENTTFSGNRAKRRGGALFFNGGSGWHSLNHVTITENTAAWGPPTTQDKHYGGGIGLWGFNGHIDMVGSIVAKNHVINDQKFNLFYKGEDCFYDGGTFGLSDAFIHDNIIGQIDNCSQFGSSFWWGIGWEGAPFDPQLGVLANNGVKTGFQTPTHKPNPGSPAIGGYNRDFGFGNSPAWDCPTADQRGYTRTQGPVVCDVGAVEYNGVK